MMIHNINVLNKNSVCGTFSINVAETVEGMTCNGERAEYNVGIV